ncbi:MAG: LTA synthase family protein [Bacteroidota bacterium]|nr:LTA synthase family protein [Bacteroidota bacterium]
MNLFLTNFHVADTKKYIPLSRQNQSLNYQMKTFFLRCKFFLQNLLPYRYNLLFFLLFTAAFYYNFWLFLDIVEQPISTELPSSVFLHIATALILALPYFLMRRHKGILLGVLFFLNFYCISNLLYYRTYFTLLPFDSFTMVNNLNGLGDSILGSFRKVDWFFPIPSVLLLLSYLFFFRKSIIPESIRLRAISSAVVLAAIVITIGYNLFKDRNNVSNLLSEENEFRYDLVEGASTYGFFHCWVYQAKSLLHEQAQMTAAEKRIVEKWLKDNKKDMSPVTVHEAGSKNVIFLIVESLESFPIGNSLNGTEITPNLNRLLKEESCLYAPHVVPQVNGGHSSDAQLIFNAGMLPPRTGAACFRYARNSYFTLAKALKEKGYNTHTMLGGNASFWNQGVLTRQLGYDDLIAVDQYNCDEYYEMGLTDSTFLAQSVEKLKAFKQPFMAQMITLSSHDPYKLPNDRIYLKVPSDCPADMAAYLNAIHYVDQCIGRFVDGLRSNGLLSKSVLIITGDHDCTKRQQAQWRVYAKRWNVETALTPFIVVNGNRQQTYAPVMGQIDIYPSLISILGLQNYQWHGLGTSIFTPEKTPFAVNARMHEFGVAQSAAPDIREHIKSAWNISDLMVTRDYFGKE